MADLTGKTDLLAGNASSVTSVNANHDSRDHGNAKEDRRENIGNVEWVCG